VPVSVPEDRCGEARYRDTVRVAAADVPVPPGVTALVAAGGNRIPITLHRLVQRRLPVHLNCAADERLSGVMIEPGTVLVRGPEEVVERTHFLPTRPYRLPPTAGGAGKDGSLTVQLPLVQEVEGRPVRAVPGVVKVRLTLQPPPRVYRLPAVPVTFLCPPDFPYRPQFTPEHPGTLALRVKAPAVARPPRVVAYIDLTAGDYKAGLHAEPLRLQLPQGCQLAQEPPPPVTFELAPTAVDHSRPGLRVVPEP
jgi:hypothetical protein